MFVDVGDLNYNCTVGYGDRLLEKKKAKCRFCNSVLNTIFADLGVSPISNAYIKAEDLRKSEPFFPLCTYVCESCFLVQLEELEKTENIFCSDYAYFSSFSSSWLEHCKSYVDMIILKLNLSVDSKVVEVASNDGYLLQYFKEKNIPHLGIEPSASVANEAINKGVETKIEFFGAEFAKGLDKADLIIGNNVLAHVPNLNDFVEGLAILLKNDGTITLEFPHLLNLIVSNQFDTIYQEHFSYISLFFAQKLFAKFDLDIYDVEEIQTHGGSLRLYISHKGVKSISSKVNELLIKEIENGLNRVSTYSNYNIKVKETKRKLLKHLINIKQANKTIVGYGAPAKGNTLLNYCSIGKDFLDYTVDISPYKQGMFLPGTRIPIKSPDVIKETKPDYILILPWNIKDEIVEQLSFVRDWGGKFIIPIPEVYEV